MSKDNIHNNEEELDNNFSGEQSTDLTKTTSDEASNSGNQLTIPEKQSEL